MGMIETLFEALSGGHGATTPLLARAMQGVIGDSHSAGPGVPWLLQRLEAAGYGPTVQTWLGAGPNQPLAAADLHAALGDKAVNEMATRAGLPPAEFVAKLSEHLPGVIDQLSPHGHLADDAATPRSV